jgi:hypothetical protein
MSLQVRQPEDTLIQLSDGDWILVKKWLNAGEANKVKTRMIKSMKAGETGTDGKAKADMEFDIDQMGGLSQAIEYLLDWSAKDPDGKPIVIRNQPPDFIQGALLGLPQDAYDEVIKAVEDHVAKMEAERVERKNVQASSSESSSISPSAVS